MKNIMDSKILVEKYAEIIRLRRNERFEGNNGDEISQENLNSEIPVKKSEDFIETGFNDFDDLSGGLKKAEVVLICSRSMDLSLNLALTLCNNITQSNNGICAFFSLKTGSDLLFQRLFSLDSRINIEILKSGLLSKTDFIKFDKSVKRFSETSLFFYDKIDFEYDYIIYVFYHLYYDNAVSVFFIDSLERFSYRDPITSWKADREQICKLLNRLSRELNITIIIMEQIYREADSEIRIEDLKKKGDYDKYMDMLLFIQSYPSESNIYEVVLKILRKSEKSVGLIDLSYIPRFCKFEGIQEYYLNNNIQ